MVVDTGFVTGSDRVVQVLGSAPIPPVERHPAGIGIDWLRAHVARFCDGSAHVRRRALVVAELDRLDGAILRERAGALAAEPLAHIRVLADCLGLSDVSPEAVEVVGAHYLPPAAPTPAADQAVAELVRACGGVADERTAARICVLVQACASVRALVGNAERCAGGGSPEQVLDRTLRDDPPIRRTRRMIGGVVAEVDLDGLPFGAGPHACPGRDPALALATGMLAGRAARRGDHE
ncbi:hypothetical protein JK358_26875 [Nocardia sp. 2]|uniref:Cytochrome P450 n=1 Tax=Nocardia acididurans TaxID=2802282 RepID=A0ABS1MCQ9_9NOCA|nr:hypothetical protein [Nocardia acididurans]MBL1078034.1 hypothetical protein [Nocardia acididurans]